MRQGIEKEVSLSWTGGHGPGDRRDVSDICFTRLAWLIMTGHFRERATSRPSPSVHVCPPPSKKKIATRAIPSSQMAMRVCSQPTKKVKDSPKVWALAQFHIKVVS